MIAKTCLLLADLARFEEKNVLPISTFNSLFVGRMSKGGERCHNITIAGNDVAKAGND
jgi:hypothetical protein